MKKFIGGLCSIAAGICTFIFFCLNFLSETGKFVKKTTYEGGYDLLKDEIIESVDGFTFHKIFAIICMVLAGLLIVMGILLILKNVGTVKTKANFGLFNNVLLVVYAVCTIITLIANFVLCGNLNDSVLFGTTTKFAPAVGAWLLVVVGVILAVVALLLGNEKASKKR